MSDGIYLGRHFDPETRKTGATIRYRGDRHMVMFGPTGSGKGRRILFPNLLAELRDESVIVIDPKGEAAAATAEARRKMGHEVVILNPFNLRGLGSAGFNPLAHIDDKSKTFYDDAAALADALIKIEGNDPHWPESAQGLLVALIMWEKQKNGPNADLNNVRRTLTEAEREVEVFDGEKTRKKRVASLRFRAEEMVKHGTFEIKSLAARFLGTREELGSIQSTADTQTRWLLSESMRDDLGKDGLDFAMLRDRPTTAYVILPADALRTHSAWLRLVIVSALRSLYSHLGDRRVVMLVDEMAVLGPLAPLEDAFALIRGYNIQIGTIFQDLGQLKMLYKERWETFIANAGVVLAFAPNDLTTADWMSRRSGTTTVVAKGLTQNAGSSTGDRTSSNLGSGSSDQQMGRALFLPQELMGLEPGVAMLWLAGLEHSGQVFASDFEKLKFRQESAT